MKIYELETRPEPLLGRLVAVWKRSVRATNDFLPDAERERIKAYVPQALRAVEHLLITENAAASPSRSWESKTVGWRCCFSRRRSAGSGGG